MKKIFLIALAAAIILQAAPADADPRPVILLHGLVRTEVSMNPMAQALEAAGFSVCNISYPSRGFQIEELSENFVLPAILSCAEQHGELPLAFVTHSLGGIIVRHLRATNAPLRFGRVVMLGPPNEGSELVDRFAELPAFEWLTGPAGLQLGTAPDDVPLSLGPTDLEVGVIAGRVSLNPLLSLIIPGKDDGRVSIDKARIEGMRDFLVVPVSHPFLMRSQSVIEQTIHFLETGRFMHADNR